MKKINRFNSMSMKSDCSDDSEYISLIKSSQKRLKLQGVTKPFQTNSQQSKNEKYSKCKNFTSGKRAKTVCKSNAFFDPFDSHSSVEEFKTIFQKENVEKNTALTPVHILDFEDLLNNDSRKRKSIVFHDPYDDDSSSDDFQQILTKIKFDKTRKNDGGVKTRSSVLKELHKRNYEEKEHIRKHKLYSLRKSREIDCFSKVSVENQKLSKSLSMSAKKCKDHFFENCRKSESVKSKNFHGNNRRNPWKNFCLETNKYNSFNGQLKDYKSFETGSRCENEDHEINSQKSEVSQYFKMKQDVNNSNIESVGKNKTSQIQKYNFFGSNKQNVEIKPTCNSMQERKNTFGIWNSDNNLVSKKENIVKKVSPKIYSSPVISSSRKALLDKLKQLEAKIKLEDFLENLNNKEEATQNSQVDYDREINLLLSQSSSYLHTQQSNKNKHQDFQLDDFLKQISQPQVNESNFTNNYRRHKESYNSDDDNNSQSTFSTKFEILLESSLDNSKKDRNQRCNLTDSCVSVDGSTLMGKDVKTKNKNGNFSNWIIKERTQWEAENNDSIITESIDDTCLNEINVIENSCDLTDDMFEENSSQDISQSGNEDNLSIVEEVSNKLLDKRLENLYGKMDNEIEDTAFSSIKNKLRKESCSKNKLIIESNHKDCSNNDYSNSQKDYSSSQELFSDAEIESFNQNKNKGKRGGSKKIKQDFNFNIPEDIEIIQIPSQNKIPSKTKTVGGRRKASSRKIKNLKTLDVSKQNNEFEICSNYSQSVTENTFNSSQNIFGSLVSVPEDNGVVILDIPEIFKITSGNGTQKKNIVDSQLTESNSLTDLDCIINSDFSLYTNKSNARTKNIVPENQENLRMFQSVPNFVKSNKDIVISHRYIENSVILTQAFDSPQEFVRNANINAQNIESCEDFDYFVSSQMSQLNKLIVYGENKLVTHDDDHVPMSLVKLRKSLDEITRDPKLVCAKSTFEITPYEKIKASILSKIGKLFYEMNEQVINNKKIVINRTACSWKNAEYEDGRLVLKSKISRLADNRRSQLKMVVYILKKVYNLLTMNSSINKREIYYQIVNYAKSQIQVDKGINIVSVILNHGQWDLGILATSQGLVYGNLKIITFDDESFHFKNTGGTLIPNKLRNIKKVESQANFILIVEKDAIFQKLLDEDVPNKLARPFILITGKGSPDLNTRYFINILWKLLQIPVFILVDADPYGIEIMMTYRFGSLSMAHKSDELALPHARWIGVHPSEIETLNLERKCLTLADVAKVKRILKRPYCDPNPKIKKELETMLANNQKAEIEGLIKCNKFISNFYLPNKFLTKDFI